MVVTDQDPALKIAIQEVLESARHRLCMWHITEKVSSKVGVAAVNVGFKAELSKIVWTDKLSPQEFDSRWFTIISDFGLGENRWLSDMFNIRSNWVPAYFRFWPMSRLMRLCNGVDAPSAKRAPSLTSFCPQSIGFRNV